MITKKPLKIRFVRAIFGCFFGILGLISPIFATTTAYADEENQTDNASIVDGERNEAGELMEPMRIVPAENNENTDNTENTEEEAEPEKKELKTCDSSLGSLGWLVCPTTGKISEAVDWLYEKNKNLLEINPVVADEESPIYLIWNYFLGIANIAFVIFLLIAIYSQITGVGISNYGIKKALPKLIIAAIMVNLSFLICSLAVDLSNIIGNGLRGAFTAIEEMTVPDALTLQGQGTADSAIAMGDMYMALAGGGSITSVAGLIAFEGGEIWLLIPAAFGALIAVVIGLITIALRQVVVVLLIMIAPLAIVAYILPNTESLFKKWKDLLIKMLVFYPAYSLLFGASSLAGWAIISSAKDGFGLILGVAVQIFPLFFSWSLMKMSGTFLGTVNAKLTGMFARPLASNRAWAESHREFTRQKFLASSNVYSPTMKLRQFMSDRKIAREEDTKEYAEIVKNRGLAYAADQYKNKDGTTSKEGLKAYEMQARNTRYKSIIERSKNDFNRGLGQLERNKRSHDFQLRKELERLDALNVKEADTYAAELARGEKIEYDNALGRQNRMSDAANAHIDNTEGYYRLRNEDGTISTVAKPDFKYHFEKGSKEYRNALARYDAMSAVMEGNPQDTQYIMANAAYAYETKKKTYESKMKTMFDYTVPTKDVEFKLDELTKSPSALTNIDAVIAGLKVLNQRGDTDLVKKQLDQVLELGVQLGTRASQSLASFLMFDVKDNDPFLRRFGKYINLETARMYNSNDRKAAEVNYEEYIKGYHIEPDGKKMYAKKDMMKLVEGTSLDAIERTAFGNLDESLMRAYGYKGDGSAWDVTGYLRKKDQIMTAIEPAFLSAMQKWQSGSEQINSGVKMWMGLENKQDKDIYGNTKTVTDENGNEDVVYSLSPVWENKAFAGYEDEVKEFYRKKAHSFVEDQVVTQVQNQRTDVRDAMNYFFEEDYFGDPAKDPEGYKKRKDDYEKVKKQIMSTRYEGKTDKEAEALNKKKLKDYYYRNIVGVPYREVLYRSGKLEQMLKTSHSGGGNNMKDWNRIMAGLDGNEAADMIKMMNERKKQEKHDEGNDGADDDTNGAPEGDAVSFANDFHSKFSGELRDIPEGTFYGIAAEYLDEVFGKGVHPVKDKFHDFYYKECKQNIRNYDLFRELRAILTSFDAGEF